MERLLRNTGFQHDEIRTNVKNQKCESVSERLCERKISSFPIGFTCYPSLIYLKSLIPVTTLIDTGNRRSSMYCRNFIKNAIHSLSYLHIFPKVYAETFKNSETPEDKTSEGNIFNRILNSDSIKNVNEFEVTVDEVREYIQNETGRDRLKSLFGRADNGGRHPDLRRICMYVPMYILGTFCLAAPLGGKMGKEKFIRKSEARKFDTKFLASRSAQDAGFIGAIKHGLFWAYRMGVFTSSFLLISQSIATYRNKTSVFEYTVAGGITCALFRLNKGLRAITATGIIGMFLGLTGGLMVVSLLEKSEQTEDLRHYMYIKERLQYEKFIKSMSSSKTNNHVLD